MGATKYDILDAVTTAVKFICGPSAPYVRLSGDNILIGANYVSIADIEDNIHSAKGFVKLIKSAIKIKGNQNE